MYLQLGDELTAVRLLKNSYLFDLNEVPKQLFILYEGKVSQEDPHRVFKPKDFIEKKFLEDDNLRVKQNYIVQENSVVLSLTREGFKNMMRNFQQSNLIILKDMLLQQKIFPQMPLKMADQIMKSVSYLIRPKGSGKTRIYHSNWLVLFTEGQLPEGAYFVVKGSIELNIPVLIQEETALPDKKYPNRLKKQTFTSKVVKSYIKPERTLFNLESSILGEEVPYSANAIQDSILILVPAS